MAHEGVELVTKVFEHTYDAETYDDLLELYHPDLVYHARAGDPEPGVHRGRDAFGQLIGGYVNSLSQNTFDVLEVIDDGDYVIASTVLNGRGNTSGHRCQTRTSSSTRSATDSSWKGGRFKTKDEALALTASKRP